MLCETISLSKTNPKAILRTYILDDYPGFAPGAKRPAVLILPGGAFTYISEREAELVALQFCAMGYHAFVLYYSVGVAAKMPAPILEGFSAISLIRDRATEWRVDPEKLVVCGFSAGGHIAGGLLTMCSDAEILAATGRTAEQLRPTAGILCYALLRLPYVQPPMNTFLAPEDREAVYEMMDDKFAEPQHPDLHSAVIEQGGTLWLDTARILHLNCFDTPNPTQAQLLRYNMVGNVNRGTPPVFLWTTVPDDTVPAADSLAFATAMLKNGRSAELHLFATGDHGLSLARPITGRALPHHPDAAWPELARTWLETTLKSPESAPASPFAD